MAKKAAKKKKAKGKAKAKHTVDEILKELEKRMRIGLNKCGKVFLTAAAYDYWRRLFLKSVKKRLKEGGDWDKEKARVLEAAEVLGKVAAALAVKGRVEKWAAQLAASVIQKYPRCGPGGSGRWCEPDV